jgi:hypothetical protein
MQQIPQWSLAKFSFLIFSKTHPSEGAVCPVGTSLPAKKTNRTFMLGQSYLGGQIRGRGGKIAAYRDTLRSETAPHPPGRAPLSPPPAARQTNLRHSHSLESLPRAGRRTPPPLPYHTIERSSILFIFFPPRNHPVIFNFHYFLLPLNISKEYR